ncbi:MAG: hypothetical protein ACYCZF_05055 [Anaerolineae bacterium]
MIQRKSNPTHPHYGQANQPQIEPALEPLSDSITEVLYARRGRLFLLCDQTQDITIPASLYQSFYLSANYDPMHSLQLAFHPFCSTEGSLVTAAALVHNMTLYAVGTELTCAWIWRSRRLIQVLPNPKGSAVDIPQIDKASVSHERTCQEAQRRLYPGDIVILNSSQAGHKMSSRLLRQAEAFSAAPGSLAKAIAQFTKSSGEPHPPVTVIRLPGTPTTPNLTPQSQMDFAYADSTVLAPQAKVSPILLAAIIAFIAIVLAVVVTKPKLPSGLLRDFLIGTPRATQTIRAATLSARTLAPQLTPSPDATLTPAD